MVIKKVKTTLKCEIKGCTNTGEYYVKRSENSFDGDSLVLCASCFKSIADYNRNKNKENKSAKQNG